MSDKFEQWMRENHPNFSPTLLEVWNAALFSLQGEAVAEFGGHRHTPKDTTEFFGWMCDSNFRLKAGAKLFTYPPSATAKIAELEAKLAEVEKDAIMWRSVSFHIEEAIRNGMCNFEIEDAYESAIQESKKGGAV